MVGTPISPRCGPTSEMEAHPAEEPSSLQIKCGQRKLEGWLWGEGLQGLEVCVAGCVGLSEEADAGERPRSGASWPDRDSASEGQAIVFSTSLSLFFFSYPHSPKNAMPSGL